MQLGLVLLSLGLLFVGAEGLVRGGASLGGRLGLSPLVIGLTVLAYGTSAPEMIVSTRLAVSGQADLAVGNIVGSNLFNIGFILGLVALVCPIRVQWQVIKFDAPVMLFVAILGALLLWDGSFGRVEGAFVFGLLVAYTTFNLWLAQKVPSTQVEAEFDSAMPAMRRAVWLDFAYLGCGLGLLFWGSDLLTTNASAMARSWGVSEAVIGLTIVSAGTSMPELSTSIVAAFRRQPDIAIGNVVGSNIFNVLGILGVTGLVSPLRVEGINPLDYGAMIGFSLCLLPLLWSGLLLRRWEGAFLLSGYGLYLWALWP